MSVMKNSSSKNLNSPPMLKSNMLKSKKDFWSMKIQDTKKIKSKEEVKTTLILIKENIEQPKIKMVITFKKSENH